MGNPSELQSPNIQFTSQVNTMLVKRTWNPGPLAWTTSHPGACCKSVNLLLVDSIHYLFSIKHHFYHGFLLCNKLWWLPMEQWVPRYGSWTSSTSTIWKVVRNVNLGSLAQICWIRNSGSGAHWCFHKPRSVAGGCHSSSTLLSKHPFLYSLTTACCIRCY